MSVYGPRSGLGVQKPDTKGVPGCCDGDGSTAEVRRCRRDKWENAESDLWLVSGKGSKLDLPGNGKAVEGSALEVGEKFVCEAEK